MSIELFDPIAEAYDNWYETEIGRKQKNTNPNFIVAKWVKE